MLPASNPALTVAYGVPTGARTVVQDISLIPSNRASLDADTLFPRSRVSAVERRSLHPYSMPRQNISEAGATSSGRYLPALHHICASDAYLPSTEIPCIENTSLIRLEGLPFDQPKSLPWKSGIITDRSNAIEWDSTPASNVVVAKVWDSYALDKSDLIEWDSTELASDSFLKPWGDNVKIDNSISIPWGTQLCDVPVRMPRDSFRLPDKIFENIFPVDAPEPEPPEPPEPPPEFEAVFLHTYKIMNTITIKDADGQQISRDGLTFNINLSLGDTSWSLSMNSHFDTTALLDTVISVDINNEEWKFLIERVSSEERFGRKSWAMSGISLTGNFKAPHDPLINGSEESESLTSNLAQLLLESEATVNWSGVDWLIPANTWSYANKTRMQAINELANAGGLIVLPSKETSSFEVRPYHLEYAWLWDTAAVNISLNQIDFFNWAESKQTKTEFNGIYVTSQRFGTSSHVARLGSAGDILLPEVSEELLTDVIANQNRGAQELSRSTPNIEVQAQIFLGEQNPSIPVGQLININAKPYHVDAISISCRGVSNRVDQQLSMSAYDAE